MKVCEGTVPETTVKVERPREIEATTIEVDGVVQEIPSRTVMEWVTETVPPHPCTEPAVVLARSMKQVKCELYDQLPNPDDGVHWVKVRDVASCWAHHIAGTMTHLDGKVTNHAAMAVEAE